MSNHDLLVAQGPQVATDYILTDLARKPDGLVVSDDSPIARMDALCGVLANTAVNFADHETSTYGQAAQRLSEWHQTLLGDCSAEYRRLTTDPNGPQLNRKEANADPDLQTLQYIRRGVRRAMNAEYRHARNNKTS